MKTFRQSRGAGSWVVYQSAVKGQPTGPNAVCDQAEWDAMEAAAPGVNRLIRGGIANEAEAERPKRPRSRPLILRATSL